MLDPSTGAPVGQPIPAQSSVHAMAFAQLDDRQILVSTAGGRVRMWELATGAPIGAALTGPTDAALWAVAVAQLDDPLVIVAAGSQGVIRTWGPWREAGDQEFGRLAVLRSVWTAWRPVRFH